jgi:hypothetical protein
MTEMERWWAQPMNISANGSMTPHDLKALPPVVDWEYRIRNADWSKFEGRKLNNALVRAIYGDKVGSSAPRPTYTLMQKLAKHVRAQCNDADHRVCMIVKLRALLPPTPSEYPSDEQHDMTNLMDDLNDSSQSQQPPSASGVHPATAPPAGRVTTSASRRPLVPLAPTAYANQIIRVDPGTEWKELVGLNEEPLSDDESQARWSDIVHERELNGYASEDDEFAAMRLAPSKFFIISYMGPMAHDAYDSDLWEGDRERMFVRGPFDDQQAAQEAANAVQKEVNDESWGYGLNDLIRDLGQPQMIDNDIELNGVSFNNSVSFSNANEKELYERVGTVLEDAEAKFELLLPHTMTARIFLESAMDLMAAIVEACEYAEYTYGEEADEDGEEADQDGEEADDVIVVTSRLELPTAPDVRLDFLMKVFDSDLSEELRRVLHALGDELLPLSPMGFANQIIRVEAGTEWKKLVGSQAARAAEMDDADGYVSQDDEFAAMRHAPNKFFVISYIGKFGHDFYDSDIWVGDRERMFVQGPFDDRGAAQAAANEVQKEINDDSWRSGWDELITGLTDARMDGDVALNDVSFNKTIDKDEMYDRIEKVFEEAEVNFKYKLLPPHTMTTRIFLESAMGVMAAIVEACEYYDSYYDEETDETVRTDRLKLPTADRARLAFLMDVFSLDIYEEVEERLKTFGDELF